MKKLLIVQFRTDASEEHEQKIFGEEYGHVERHLEYFNAVHHKFPTNLDKYAGVVLGGSGQFMLSNNDGVGTWRERNYKFVDRLIETDIPVLGICFGFQLLALHQGAKIVTDKNMEEVGMFPMQLTGAGEVDPFFKDIPFEFMGSFGHKETIVDAPDHLIRLASTDRVHFSAFRMKDKNIWGTLSHPELDEKRIVERVKLFPNYAKEGVDAFVDTLKPVPHISKMLHNFLEICDFGNVCHLEFDNLEKKLEYSP